MQHSTTHKYSSVVLNQNQPLVEDYKAEAFYDDYIQEFHLPADYRRGTETGELRYPDLSGIQLFVRITEGYARQAAFNYELQYQVFGLGWVTAASGVAIGAPNDGDAWMTAYFTDPVEIDQSKAAARWRIVFDSNPRPSSGLPRDVVVPYANGEANVLGTRVVVDLTKGEPYHFEHNFESAFLYWDPIDDQVYFSYEQGITYFLATTPNPLALPFFERAYSNTNVLDDTAFGFRVLALAAEEGVDFLGNQYRSVVVRNKPEAISTSLGSDPNTYWLSKPNPSKFAVESLYFDVRKPGSTTYGDVNKIRTPSFETDAGDWDGLAQGPIGDVSTFEVTDEQAHSGSKSLKVTVGDTGLTRGVSYEWGDTDDPAKQGATYSAIVQLRAAAGTLDMQISMEDNLLGNGIVFSSVISIGTEQWNEITLTWTPTADSPNPRLYILVDGATDTGAIFYLDSVSVIRSDEPRYFDGDMAGYVWTDTAHASQSAELVLPEVQDVSTVIDRVVVDPITPGAYFTIYYSDEGDPATTEDVWENKLWTRIPHTYRMERRETHVLPEPVRAKYVKIEFSHLQARHYAPGNFQQTIRYKKHPKWVLDYFLARLQVDTNFLAERVTVIYDAIDLAYNYYLDDLGQEPSTTIDVNNTALTQVTSFLQDRTDASDRVDSETLDRLDLVLQPYRQHPALRGYADTLLSTYARQTVDPNTDYMIEGARATSFPTADVSSLNRDRVVIEQNYPVMFFYLTCRHKYREIEAKFSHDRAYFAGVRQIAFLRDNYMTAFDATTYIEPAGDTQNVERNEFI